MIIDELIAKLGFVTEGEGELNKFNRGLEDAEKKAQAVARRVDTLSVAVGSFFGNIAANITTKVATAIGSLPGDMTRAAADFESLMTGIEKKAGASAEQMARIKADIQDLSTGRDLASSIDEIAAAYERGAAAGIPIEDLREFAKLTAMAADAFEMSAEKVGNAAAGFEKGLGVARDQMEGFFDLINTLADAGISDESDIIDFLDRAGASLTSIGMSKEEVAALGATLVNLKMPAEVAARAMDTLSGKLVAPQNLGKKARTAFQAIVGDMGSFAQVVAEDANAGLMLFLEKLENIDSAKRAGLLGALLGEGFDDEISRLVVGLDEYRRNLALAQDQEQWLGSLRQSYEKKLDDYWSKSQRFWNNHQNILRILGERTLPIFGQALDDASDFMRDIAFDGSLDKLADYLEATLWAARDFGDNLATAVGVVYRTADAVTELTSKVTGLNKEWSAGVLGAAVVGSTQTGRAALKELAKKVPAVAAILILEDIVAGLSGKESYIGNLEGGKEALDNLRESAEKFGNAVAEVQPAWEKLLSTDPKQFMNESLLQFVNDMTHVLQELAIAIRAFQQGDLRLAIGMFTHGVEGKENLDRLEAYQERRGRRLKAQQQQGEQKGAFDRFREGLTRTDEAGGSIEKPIIPSSFDPAGIYEALHQVGTVIADSWRASVSQIANSKGDRLSFAGPQPDPTRFDATPAQPANAEAMAAALANFRGNLAKVQPEAAAQAVINDNRISNDNRNQSVIVNSTVNQTVQQATQAPAAAAQATSQAVGRAAVPPASRLEATPAF